MIGKPEVGIILAFTVPDEICNHFERPRISFLVIRRNQKASVDLALYDDNDRLIEVGSVKIRNSTFNEIKEGTILECRYMHAFSVTRSINLVCLESG